MSSDHIKERKSCMAALAKTSKAFVTVVLEDRNISRKISELVKKEHKYRIFGNNGNYIVNTNIIGVFQRKEIPSLKSVSHVQ